MNGNTVANSRRNIRICFHTQIHHSYFKNTNIWRNVERAYSSYHLPDHTQGTSIFLPLIRPYSRSNQVLGITCQNRQIDLRGFLLETNSQSKSVLKYLKYFVKRVWFGWTFCQEKWRNTYFTKRNSKISAYFAKRILNSKNFKYFNSNSFIFKIVFG